MNTQNSPIRVLHIIARLNVGGPAIYVTLLTEKLGPPDYDSRLVCGTIEPGEGDMRYFAEQHGIQPLIIPELGRALNPRRDLVTLWKVYQLMRSLKPDVVHTHTAKAGFVGRLAAWAAGVPVIVHTFHGHVFKGYFSPAMTGLFIRLERLTARVSDTIITLTESLRRELAEDYRITRKARITVLPLGMDLEVFARVPRKQGSFRSAWNIPAEAPLVGIIGRMAIIKNHGLFLEAAVQVRQQLPGARFVIVGDGETRVETEALVDALGLRDVVIFTGWQRDMLPIYSDLDVLAISSLNEGTPTTAIEALAAGCPVAATAVGGVPDLLDRGRLGRLTTPGDPDSLAEGILDVLRHPPDPHTAQAVMLDRYGIDRLVKDMDGLYRGLLAKKGRRPPA